MNKTAASLIKKLAAILTFLLLGLSAYSQELHPKAPRVPEKIVFAGETIRFDSDDMYERMDRELLSFTYMHTNTTLMLKRSKRIFSIVVPILKRNGIPEDLKYLMAIESNLDPKAVSTAGAAGLWQFMKGTGREYGLEVGAEVDERFHIEKATIAACKYLKSAYSAFGDWMTVAASYNSGRGGILKRREEQGERSAFNLMLPEAAEKLLADFGNGVELPYTPAPPKPPDSAQHCHDVLLQMEVQLHRQKRLTAPQTMDDPITTEYAKNCQMYDFIVGLADLLSGGTEQQKADEIAYLTGGVLDRYERVLQKEVIAYDDIF